MKVFKRLLPLFLAVLFVSCQSKDITDSGTDQDSFTSKLDGAESRQSEDAEGDDTLVSKVRIIIDGNEFTMTLADTAAAQNFKEILPATMYMSELNGNEKDNYTGYDFDADPRKVSYINRGDVMLYGKDCVVLFYRSFNTSYSYTRLGSIDDAEGLALAVGSGGITVTFELREE